MLEVLISVDRTSGPASLPCPRARPTPTCKTCPGHGTMGRPHPRSAMLCPHSHPALFRDPRGCTTQINPQTTEQRKQRCSKVPAVGLSCPPAQIRLLPTTNPPPTQPILAPLHPRLGVSGCQMRRRRGSPSRALEAGSCRPNQRARTSTPRSDPIDTTRRPDRRGWLRLKLPMPGPPRRRRTRLMRPSWWG